MSALAPELAGVSTVVELAVVVQPRELLRYLGYPRSRQPAPSMARRIEELAELAALLVRARGGHRLVGRAEAEAAGMPDPGGPSGFTPMGGAAVKADPDPGERVGVGLCTIGPLLEEEACRRSAGGQELESLVLDAYGSAAAEAAADALDRTLCGTAARLGLIPERRISPGYGRWSLEGQRALLALLPAAELGVTLSDGMMMIPRKSVSFAARLSPLATGRSARTDPRRRRCAACTLERCAYRVRGSLHGGTR